MKTIAKNRAKFIDDLFARGWDFTCYSLENCFAGKKVSAEWVKKELFTFSFAKLKENGEGKYSVDVHGNLWYEFNA